VYQTFEAGFSAVAKPWTPPSSFQYGVLPGPPEAVAARAGGGVRHGQAGREGQRRAE
jgi:hypothetical protein